MKNNVCLNRISFSKISPKNLFFLYVERSRNAQEKQNKVISIIILLLLTLSACVPDMKERGYDTKKLAEEVKDRKIKKLTPAQINTWVYERGVMMANLLNAELTKTDIEKLKAEKQTLKTQDSLQKTYKVQIALLNLTNKDLPNRYTGKAKAVIEACIYQAENEQVIQPNLQKLENDNFLFTAAAEKPPKHLWQISFEKKEVIRKIDQKEFNP
jgi:hypothetical protein